MSKRQTIKIAEIIGLIFLLFALIFAVISVILPYNKEQWSALYFEADLTRIYGTTLDELKNAYKDLTSLDYYEISDQFLEITYPSIEIECLYGYEYGIADTWKQQGTIVYPTKCFQVSQNCCSTFEIVIEEGQIFSAEDMEYIPNKAIPIIAGHEYAGNLHIGDLLEGTYLQRKLNYEVIGILREDANIDLGGQKVCLDRYLLMPSFNVTEAPQDADDDLFQVRHYANKLSGKIHYNSYLNFLRYYMKIYDINHSTLLTEGEIIF